MTKFTDPKALQILNEEQAANEAFFAEMDAKIKKAQDNTPDEQIWTTPNQRRLIAAAPELLTTLEILLDALSRNGGSDSVAVMTAKMNARAAIAKAKGE